MKIVDLDNPQVITIIEKTIETFLIDYFQIANDHYNEVEDVHGFLVTTYFEDAQMLFQKIIEDLESLQLGEKSK